MVFVSKESAHWQGFEEAGKELHHHECNGPTFFSGEKKGAYGQGDEEAGEEVPEAVEEGADDGREGQPGRPRDGHDAVVRKDEEGQEHDRRVLEEFHCGERKGTL
jgi:hypothetical protein